MTQELSGDQPKPNSELHPAAHQLLVFMDRVVELAKKSPSHFLLGLGTLVIVLAFMTKVSGLGKYVVSTQPVEFVVMMLVGLAIVLSGAVVSFYIYRSELDVYRDQLRSDASRQGRTKILN